jgi:predicted outer membrane repeat protein
LQGTFGGAVFAMGDATQLQLQEVSMNNNTAAAGGAIATLQGSRVNCTAKCTFNFNQAKVGAACWYCCMAAQPWHNACH